MSVFSAHVFRELGSGRKCVSTMAPKHVPDGASCENPLAVAQAWDELPLVQTRAHSMQRLILSASSNKESVATGDSKGQVLATKENLVHNNTILEVLVKDMVSRNRVGADPIDVIAEMTMAWYALHPFYAKLVPKMHLTAWAYGDAWTLHKMISSFRSPVVRYSTCRVFCLHFWLGSVFLYAFAYIPLAR